MLATATRPNSSAQTDSARRPSRRPEAPTGRTGLQDEVAAVRVQHGEVDPPCPQWEGRPGFLLVLLRALSAWGV